VQAAVDPEYRINIPVPLHPQSSPINLKLRDLIEKKICNFVDVNSVLKKVDAY
jgi:hypothetical protein